MSLERQISTRDDKIKLRDFSPANLAGLKSQKDFVGISEFLLKSHSKNDQNTIYINEPGLYALILKSEMKEAKKFQKWVITEVLPAIRKTGTYTKPTNENKFCGFDLEPYDAKYCAYILNIGDGLYKFGRSADIKDRFSHHKSRYPNFKIVRIYTFSDYNESKNMEYSFRSITKRNKIQTSIEGKGIELFKPTVDYTLDDVLRDIDIDCDNIKHSSSDMTHNIIEKYEEIDDKEDIILKDIHDGQRELVNNMIKYGAYKDTPEKYIELLDKYDSEYASKKIKKITVSTNVKIKKKNPIHKHKVENVEIKKTATINKHMLNMTNKCVECDTVTYKTSDRCIPCEKKGVHLKAIKDTNRPSLATLLKDIAETSYVATGKKYGVSDNCIRKWIKKYNKYGSG